MKTKGIGMGLQSTLDQIMSIRKCPECGGNKFIRSYADGQLLCENCGFVVPREHKTQKPPKYEKLLQLTEGG